MLDLMSQANMSTCATLEIMTATLTVSDSLFQLTHSHLLSVDVR